jgi:DMSO/TMAO reductase YedYZ molybdopterin-dependent catalytic subunit
VPEKDQKRRQPEDQDVAGNSEQRRVSRRSLLGAAGVGAAGIAAGAFAVASPALAAVTKTASTKPDTKPAAKADDRPDTVPADEPVIIHIANAHTGELDVFAGTSHTKLRDPALAAQLRRAAK